MTVNDKLYTSRTVNAVMLNWPISYSGSDCNTVNDKVVHTFHLTLTLTSSQVVKMSVINNSSFQS